MAKLNKPRTPLRTHEGAVAKHITPEQQLKRSVMSCMLWENEFYEDGISISKRIAELVPQVDPIKVAFIAENARSAMKLRHVPLLVAREMARHKSHSKWVAGILEYIIQRPDELTEYLAIYWKTNNGKKTISAQSKKGLAKAFQKFDEYSLAKYNRDDAIKLRDVLFLCHAEPKDTEQAALWARLVNNELTIPDTWEVALSSGADKKSTWERLLVERKLGALALLRNLRNMTSVGVSNELIKESLNSMKTERVLPFRFITAARYAPFLEPLLEVAMFRCLEGKEKLKGKTILLVDVSGSMDQPISAKSEMTRMDGACGLAVLARELCDEVNIYTFSNNCVPVPTRRGFALRDAIINSQLHSCTYLGKALESIAHLDADRLIIFTDEQSHDRLRDPLCKGYVINVASYQNGVGYGAWNHVDGFSEAVFDFIIELERENV